MTNAFDAEQVDAIALRRTVLQLRFGDAPNVTIRYLGINPEPIAIAVPDGQTGRRDKIDAALAEIIADGTWSEIFVTEFGVDPWFDPATLASVPPIGS